MHASMKMHMVGGDSTHTAPTVHSTHTVPTVRLLVEKSQVSATTWTTTRTMKWRLSSATFTAKNLQTNSQTKFSGIIETPKQNER